MKRAMTTMGALLLLAAGPALAQEGPKIAYVDSERLIREAPGYTEANEAFNQTASVWRDSLEMKRERLEDLYEEYQKQQVILSPEKKTEKQEELLRLEQEAQTYFQQKFGPEGEATKRQAELMEPIITRVNRAIEEVRRDEAYAMIFDLNDGALVAGDPALNITDRVVERMRSETASSSR